MKGFIHLYTGDGKGKTTAALGQAIRQYGLECFILKTPSEKDVQLARQGLNELLVTEMKEVKHNYNNGVMGRKGIEY